MSTHYFWDIENVSFHNLDVIMEHIRATNGYIRCYVVYAKIKAARKDTLIDHGWELIKTEGIGRNSADKKIIEMIRTLLDSDSNAEKIVIISEDKGFYKIGRTVIDRGLDVEIICSTKNPLWVHDLADYKKFNRRMKGYYADISGC